MWSNSLPLLPVSLWAGGVLLVRVLSSDQIELSNPLLVIWNYTAVCKLFVGDRKRNISVKYNILNYLTVCEQMIKIWTELFMLDSNTLNQLIMRKQMSSNSFKNKVTNKLFTWRIIICNRIANVGYVAKETKSYN